MVTYLNYTTEIVIRPLPSLGTFPRGFLGSSGRLLGEVLRVDSASVLEDFSVPSLGNVLVLVLIAVYFKAWSPPYLRSSWL